MTSPWTSHRESHVHDRLTCALSPPRIRCRRYDGWPESANGSAPGSGLSRGRLATRVLKRNYWVDPRYTGHVRCTVLAHRLHGVGPLSFSSLFFRGSQCLTPPPRTSLLRLRFTHYDPTRYASSLEPWCVDSLAATLGRLVLGRALTGVRGYMTSSEYMRTAYCVLTAQVADERPAHGWSQSTMTCAMTRRAAPRRTRPPGGDTKQPRGATHNR